ncbi:hypothetical protein [Streptomyces sp. NPDC005438]|uniref:hypothetical protein n=1 Tax=Streptomyces sp. NPDC005438 TaxID=3156880 RepID=UPI0033A4175F
MGNVFEGDGVSLELSNGGTEVFVEVLVLAVSDLAEDEWDHRFAALLTWQDQNVRGRGAVGFDLRDIAWGSTPAECTRAKDFVLRSVDLALTGHRWDELGYDPPFVRDHLRRFRSMVASFTPTPADGPGDGFPSPEERAATSCVRHRVLSALPHQGGCLLCASR